MQQSLRSSAGLVALAVAAVALATWGWDPTGLNFFVDERVDIITPQDLEEVRLPHTVHWRAEDVARDQTHFGVFVDREPMPPGKHLKWLARNDVLCAPDPACPDDAWLALRNVYVVNATELTIEALADRRSNGRGLDRHTVTIVLLDTSGRRIGESAWSREFILSGEEPSG